MTELAAGISFIFLNLGGIYSIFTNDLFGGFH